MTQGSFESGHNIQLNIDRISLLPPVFVNLVLSALTTLSLCQEIRIIKYLQDLAVEWTLKRLLYESLFLFSVILWAAIHVFK